VQFELISNIPWQQLFYLVDGMISDTLNHVLQIAVWIDFVEFASSCRAPDYAEPLHFSPVFPRFAEHPFGIV